MCLLASPTDGGRGGGSGFGFGGIAAIVEAPASDFVEGSGPARVARSMAPLSFSWRSWRVGLQDEGPPGVVGCWLVGMFESVFAVG